MKNAKQIVSDNRPPFSDAAVGAAVALHLGLLESTSNPLATAALMAGSTDKAFLALLNDPAFVAQVEAKLLEMRASGAESRVLAKSELTKVVSRVAEKLDDPELHVTTLVKAGEFLHKVSAVAEEHAAELRKQEPNIGPQLFVLYDGDTVPEAKDGQPQLIIDLSSRKPVAGAAKEVGHE